MSRRRDSRRIKRSRRRNDEDINPMNYISNLSDVMLILAVGIMLSLVIHWQVDLDVSKNAGQEEGQSQSEMEVTTTFTENDLEDSGNVPDTVERLGDVYYDPESGTYYIAADQEGSSSESEADGQ